MRGVLWSCLVFLLALAPLAARAESRLVDFEVASKRFDGAKVGVSPVRKVVAYLPDGYEAGSRRYPVVYFLPNLFDDQRAVFDRDGARAALDRAIDDGAVPPLILVSADFSTPAGSSFYATSPVTGDWTGFLAKDLVAAVDGRFRTLPPRPRAVCWATAWAATARSARPWSRRACSDRSTPCTPSARESACRP
ncbi:alpha/beta hydrolase-fold protein [Caulobacter flavus]|uniref:alpha/beta hydrolase-fold protein n=1 Tax=Caulobacter flavus TaxID=1679497 RepID=UPI001F0C3D8D|nr:alpha/beta hydrolase-fold protein [Caulobacter flavus]